MQDLRVTLVQAEQSWEDKSANLSHFEQLLAPVHETDLIVLPEMFHTAFTMNAADLAESMDASVALDWLKKLAAEKNAAVYTSFIARDKDAFFNRGTFVTPAGEVTFYDKRRTFGLAGESDIYACGDREQIVSWKGWKINLQICYDLRFPELVRNGMTAEGSARYDALIYVANWPERRAMHWSTLLKARAIENQCYVIGVNRVGEDAHGLSYSGNSAVFDALGEAVGETIPGTEAVKIVNLSYSNLTDVRTKLPFLKDSNHRSFTA